MNKKSQKIQSPVKFYYISNLDGGEEIQKLEHFSKYYKQGILPDTEVMQFIADAFDGYFHEVLDMSEVSAGMYFIELIMGNRKSTQKLIVQ